MGHIQTQEEWEVQMAEKILSYVRNELYLELRYLDVAFSALVPQADASLQSFATDGGHLFYSTEQILRVFEKNAPYLNRAYLHTVLHCIFSHPWIAGNRDRRLWNLACDVAVEYTIDGLGKKCTKRILSWTRQKLYEELREQKKGVSAAVVYDLLWERYFPLPAEGMPVCEEWQALAREFYTDSHKYWPKREDDAAKCAAAADNQKKWNQIARQTRMEQERRGEKPKDGEDLLAAQLAAGKSRRSYRDFLQKFAVLHEELHADLEEFDLSYYTYGLSVYGNLPLIEPLESREVKKIREFVIVIDTSYSTSGALVRAFLAETYTLLKGQENFFHRMNLHLIQADNAIRQDLLIRNEDELIHAMNHFELRGGGGTDFRPAFAYVDRLCAEKKFSNLRGLLYFTDGMGTYPAKRPAYDTAFLFLGERFDDANVPPWAMKVVLDEEEFTGAAVRPASALADALAEEDDLYRDLNNS